jgi:hypothetical protein
MISHVQGVQNAIAGLPKDTTIRLNMVTVHTTINKTQHQLSGRSGDPGQFGSPLVPHASSAGGGFTPSPSHASFGSGPAVFHIYDADRKLLGSMRGVAKEEIHGQATFDKRMFRMLGAQSPRTKRR